MNFKNIVLILLFLSLSTLYSNNRIAYVYYVEGESFIKNDKVHLQSKEAISGREIYSGDIIKVKNNSRCSIYFHDKTAQIVIGENSRIQIIQTDLSKEIKIEQGSVYVHNLLNPSEKFYIITHNNQFFLENDRVWISSDFFNGDKLFSLDYPINVFNKVNKKSLYFDNNIVHYYFNSGKILYSNVIDSIVPSYVLDRINDNIYEISNISLKKGDLIPIYGDRIRQNIDESVMKYTFGFSSLQLNDESYFSLNFYPQYKHNNLSFGFNFDPFFTSSGELLDNDWDDEFDFIDRFYLNFYHSENTKNNEMYLHYGKINNLSFAQGYLLKNFNNSFDYPRMKNSGLHINYKFDDDFMNFELAIPNFSDLMYSGGVISARTSLYISHRFPLTLGLGLVADINQMSFVENQYNVDFNKKRSVYGAEFDFYYELFKINNIDVSIYGEFAGIWFPESVYYVLFDDANNVANDLRYRKGVWGVCAPGVHIDFNRRLEIKLSYNQNSALFIPSYFNSNYLSNRGRYYNNTLDFPLVDQQIDLLEKYQIDGRNDEFVIPKDLYPLLFQNEGFSAYQVKGFTTEIEYNIRNYLEFNLLSAVYIEESSESNTFYSIDCNLGIKDNFIRGVSFINFYYSNTFFSKLSDKERLNLGMNLGVELPFRLSLILDMGQLYYNSSLSNNNLDQMLNTSISINYRFR